MLMVQKWILYEYNIINSLFSFFFWENERFWILAWTVSKSASKGFKLTKYPKSRKVSSWVDRSRKRPKRLRKAELFYIRIYLVVPIISLKTQKWHIFRLKWDNPDSFTDYSRSFISEVKNDFIYTPIHTYKLLLCE